MDREIKKTTLENKRIIEEMGGEVKIDKQNRIYISLPIRNPLEGVETFKSKDPRLIEFEIKRRIIEIFGFIENEKKFFIKNICTINWREFLEKNLKEKILELVSVFLDWLVIRRFFNLQKEWLKIFSVIILNPEFTFSESYFNLRFLKFYSFFTRWKKLDKELRFLDEIIKRYCESESYYEKFLQVLIRNFFPNEPNFFYGFLEKIRNFDLE